MIVYLLKLDTFFFDDDVYFDAFYFGQNKYKKQQKSRKSKEKQGDATEINGKSCYFGTKFRWFQSAEAKKLAKICKQNASIFKRIQETTDFRPCIFNDFQGSFKDFGSDTRWQKKNRIKKRSGKSRWCSLAHPLQSPWFSFCFCLKVLLFLFAIAWLKCWL